MGDSQYPVPALEDLMILQGRDYKAVQAPGSGECTLSHKPERCESSENAGLVTEAFLEAVAILQQSLSCQVNLVKQLHLGHTIQEMQRRFD